MKGELYEFNGEMLSQAEIARRTGINRSTLADWYKKTNNMDKAVEGALKSQAQRNIPYYDEVLSLKAISDREKLKFESLRDRYYAVGDIYEAVRLTKESQQKRKGTIMYKGKLMSFTAIALENDIDRKSLERYFNQTEDIYKAIELTKKAQEIRNGTIEYGGRLMTTTAIANEEGIKRDTLKKYYLLYGNIEKAILIVKKSQLKRKNALLKGKQVPYEELAREFNMSVIELEKRLESGESVDKIKKKTKKGVSKDEIVRFDEDSLYHYCLEHSYNYWVINRMIKSYGKKPKEAIIAYLENGQNIPTKWIYEKYGLLFKHLVLNYGLDSNRIIKNMKENNCTIEEAIISYIFKSNNSYEDFDQVEIDWMEELYYYIKDINKEEYNTAKEVFYISKEEEQFINSKKEKIDTVMRQLLLFEFSNILEEWPIDELNGMMELYDITEEEKNNIVLDLYSPFKDKVIDPKKIDIDRNNMIRNIILDYSVNTNEIISSSDLSSEEKEEILKKRTILDKLMLKGNKTEFKY